MSKEKTIRTQSAFMIKVKDLGMLVKFRLTLTVVFSAFMAFLIASEGSIDWVSVLILVSGGFLITGASNTLNQVLEKDFDKLMARTENRPLATGRMNTSEAVLWAGFMTLAGIMLLAYFNVWAAFFGMVALVSYAFIYTPMKRVSPIAITIGAFPGALPVLIGCVAYQGELTMLGLSLFLIQFLWQFPHFLAIGWLGFDDYQKAGYQLLPTRNGEREPNTGFHSMLYAVLLIPFVIIPYYYGITGIWSMIFAVVVTLIYTWFGWNLQQKKDRKSALQLMFSSFFYLPFILIAFLIDKV